MDRNGLVQVQNASFVLKEMKYGHCKETHNRVLLAKARSKPITRGIIGRGG